MRQNSNNINILMTYPDGEVVSYTYNAAGNLRGMNSEKDGRRYEIVKQLGYNEDEQKVFQWLGNGTKTTHVGRSVFGYGLPKGVHV